MGSSPLNCSLYLQGTHPWQLPVWTSVHTSQHRLASSTIFYPHIRLSGISVSPKKMVLKPLRCRVLRALGYCRHCLSEAVSKQPLQITCLRSGFAKRCMLVSQGSWRMLAGLNAPVALVLLHDVTPTQQQQQQQQQGLPGGWSKGILENNGPTRLGRLQLCG